MNKEEVYAKLSTPQLVSFRKKDGTNEKRVLSLVPSTEMANKDHTESPTVVTLWDAAKVAKGESGYTSVIVENIDNIEATS